MLSVLSDTTVTGRDVSSVLSGVGESGGHSMGRKEGEVSWVLLGFCEGGKKGEGGRRRGKRRGKGEGRNAG